MNNNIINFAQKDQQDSPALKKAKDAIDDMTEEDTDALFHYLLAMDYPLWRDQESLSQRNRAMLHQCH